MSSASTAIVLLNWNGADDTIACVHSLLRMQNQDFFMIVCDNNSADGSFYTLKEWGESFLGSAFTTWELGRTLMQEARLVLIQTGANLGFAGGCNVGIRFALLQSQAQYVWLLNNDTIVDSEALSAQLEKMQSRPDVGILGSTLIFLHKPDCMQAPGGYDFNFWTARVLPLYHDLSPTDPPAEVSVEERLKYISGASMFVRRRFLEQVGLLNEQYFLYFEEVDWATRAGSLFLLGYCSRSKVRHKEGGSIGSDRRPEYRSSFSERSLARSRVLFLRTYFPWRIVVCLAWILCVGLIRLMRGHMRAALSLWKGTVLGLRAPIQKLPQMDEWPVSMQQNDTRAQGPFASQNSSVLL